ncbi:MAG: hypothetical protein IJW75_03355 [Alphaproteobacteria bacterium]|nr:hypothetical protein [Alphaproteobacteria bacterium]
MNTEDKYIKDEEFSFDWKKKSVENKERLTLKNDINEAIKFEAKNKAPTISKKSINPENLPLGLLKMRKKIRDIYDEDDEDEDDTFFAHIKMPEDEEDNSLLNALNDDEKKIFNQQNTLHHTKMQQNAGKMEALHIANNLAKEAGLHNISQKALEIGMQEATFDPQKRQEKIIEQEIGKKLGIKGNIKGEKITQAAKGIKKVEQLGGKEATKNIEMKDMVKAGEEKLSDQELAKLILEKSGQKVNLDKHKKSQRKIKLEYLENSTKHKDNSNNGR